MENVLVRTGGSGKIGNRRKTEVTDESEGAAELQGPRLGVIVLCPLFFECYYINCELTERQFGAPTGQRRQ